MPKDKGGQDGVGRGRWSHRRVRATPEAKQRDDWKKRTGEHAIIREPKSSTLRLVQKEDPFVRIDVITDIG